MGFYKSVLSSALMILIVSSIFLYNKVNHLASGVHYNYLPSNLIFEGIMIIFFFSSFSGRLKGMCLFFFYVSFLYIIYGFSCFLIIDNSGRLSDFLLIYKPFFYICILSVLYGKKIFEKAYINRIYIILIVSFIFKYSISIFVFKISRPGLFTENNFELMLLAFVFLATYDEDREFESWNYCFLVFIGFLSFSRSAILFVLMIFFFVNFKGFLRSKFLSYVSLLFFILIVLAVFLSRLGDSGIESVDRYIFLIHFLREMSNSGIYTWLFGNPPMTNVTLETASALEYYHLVFSDYDNLIAFSPVFNSFILRVIFDHGIISLLFITYFSYLLVRNSTRSIGIALSSCSILIVNGLSVSSFQSVYFLLGIFILVSSRDG